MAARCEECGGHVMPYRTYAFWMKPTAECAECGSAVRLRHFWTVCGLGVAILLGTVGTLAVLPAGSGLGVLAAMALAMLAIDYASYHILTWEADPAFEGEGEPRLLRRARDASEDLA